MNSIELNWNHHLIGRLAFGSNSIRQFNLIQVQNELDQIESTIDSSL